MADWNDQMWSTKSIDLDIGQEKIAKYERELKDLELRLDKVDMSNNKSTAKELTEVIPG